MSDNTVHAACCTACSRVSLVVSHLLQAAAAVAPRGLYLCGPTSSTAGLTASVVRDPLTGGFALEAGALVLADRGICCVDEFNKITAEHQVICPQGMEQLSWAHKWCKASEGLLCRCASGSIVSATFIDESMPVSICVTTRC